MKGLSLRRLRIIPARKGAVQMTSAELEECIELYGKEIYSFCRRMTGNVQEGEDLYQDTFLTAMEHLVRMDKNQNPKSYLLSIAIRLWRNKRRKCAWRQRIAKMESLDEKTEGRDVASAIDKQTKGMPEAEMLEQEKTALVYLCIQGLAEKYRIPIYLYYSAELSVAEIANCLKLPEGTIKSRLYKGRKIMKEKLEVAGYDR